MEITKENFITHFPIIKSLIKECDFYSMDLEFTGISLPNNKYLSIESRSQRYQKVRKIAKSYLPIQVGLCTFKFNEDTKSFDATPFSIYIYPDPSSSENRKNFTCNSSTLSFLLTHKFNFIKWIREGLHFTRLDEIKPIEKKLVRNDKSEIAISDQNREYVAQIRDTISTWYKSNTSETATVFATNSYQRRLVFQEAKRICENMELSFERFEAGIKLSKFIDEEEKMSNGLSQEKKVSLNFSELFSLLAECGKPIIGHNCFLDWCFIVQHFLCELPDTLKGFKELITKKFPIIIDTKLVFHKAPEFKEFMGNSSLDYLLSKLEQGPFKSSNLPINIINLVPGEDEFVTVGSKGSHDAGYDALSTGKLFVYLSSYLAAKQTNNITASFNFENVKMFANQLYNMFSEFDTINLNGNEEDIQTKKGKFILTNITEQVTPADLYLMLQSAPLEVNQLHWIDSTQCWVSFKTPVQPRLSANALLSPNELEGLYNKIPTGKFEMLWKSELLQLPQGIEDQGKLKACGEVNLLSWTQWYSSIKKDKLWDNEITTDEETSEDDSNETDSDSEENEDSSEKGSENVIAGNSEQVEINSHGIKRSADAVEMETETSDSTKTNSNLSKSHSVENASKTKKTKF